VRLQTPLILGGGPAGSAAAIMLARGGTKPLVLEASRETGDALCGGFVSWRTMETLEALGLEIQPLGHSVTRLRLFAGLAHAEAPLPRPAIGISRRTLDTLLLAEAMQAGAAIERGITVRAIGETVRLADSTELSSDCVMIATGKHGLRGLDRQGVGEPALGLRLRLPAHPSLTRLVSDAIELHLFADGYAGLVLQEDGSANLCLAVRKTRLAESQANPNALITALGAGNPALGERLAFWDGAGKIDAIGAVPYGWIAGETRPRQFLLGDAAACIPSLAGEGNGLALASGVQAARFWLEGKDASQFQHAFARRVNRPIKRALRLWHWAEQPGIARIGVKTIGLVPWLGGLAADLTRIDR
jgi:menaquinone-9 beta-reductase